MVSLDKALLKRAALRRFYTIYCRIKTFYTKKNCHKNSWINEQH